MVVGSVSGFVYSIHREETKSWYNALRKPSFNPPSWLFPPVWTGLYVRRLPPLAEACPW